MSETLTETQVGLPQTGSRSFADILLLVAGFVVVGLGAAWFLSGSLGEREEEVLLERPAAEVSAAAGDELAVSAAAGEDAEVNLNKARMAAGADMLVEPAGQNALYYYSLVLDAEPEHAEAAGELADIAEQVATGIRGHLGASEFVEAARLASMLANVTPGHPVIVEVQETLIAEQQRLVMEAVDLARKGSDGEAASRLAAAESVPQVDDALIVTARKEIGAIRAERAAAARQAERRRQEAAAARAAAAAKAASEKAAAEKAAAEAAAKAVADAGEAGPAEATPPPAAKAEAPAPAPTPLLVRGRERLEAGRLIAPADDSALDYLARAETEAPDSPELAGFREDLITAMSVAIRDSIDAGRLEDAEEMLIELESVSGADSVSGSLKSEVDRAFSRRESARVISASEMLATKIIPPVYPRSAIRRGQEGWVQVEFTVLSDGSTADVEIVSASPEDVFDRSSVQAVTQWQFRPRVFRGEPIDQRVTTKINFNLQDG